MIIECSHCGAPLDVKQGDTFARCCYCGTTQRVRKARTTMQHTPPNWRPPPQWTPPQHFRAPSVPLNLDVTKTVRKVVIIIVALTIITGILPLACGIMMAVGSFASSPADDDRATRPSRPAVPGRSKSGKVSDSCNRAKACCEVVTAGNNSSACDALVQANDTKACMQALRGFQQAAKAQGKKCK